MSLLKKDLEIRPSASVVSSVESEIISYFFNSFLVSIFVFMFLMSKRLRIHIRTKGSYIPERKRLYFLITI